MTTPSAVERATRRRTREIFASLRQQVFVETDRMFAVLMTLQWLFGIAAAFWISPNTWAGPTRSTHIHVWAAIGLGGVITALPVALAILQPGRASTRYTIAVGQMFTSALLIHLTGGRIETHFHVFGSLAFLAFYRDWKVLVPATLVVVGDHLVRGLFWPESVYGVMSASIWRTVEHGGWVVFEDIVLVSSCLRGTREQWRVAARTAEFETSQDRYRAVVDQSAEGILVFDADRRTILERNAAFLRLAGIEDKNVDQLIVDDALLQGDAPLDDTVTLLLRDRLPITIECRLRRPDQTTVHVTCSLSPTLYAGNQAVSVVMRDVTERKRIDVDLARAHDAAVESARLKSEFLANMSHEIRTPMNGIVGMSGLLMETGLTGQQRDFAETIQTSADALLTVVNDILDFSKIEAGKLEFEILDFDLRQALEGPIDLIAPRAFAKGLELALLLEPGVPTDLRGDQGRLRQVLTNLVGNAVKFTDQGEVVLRAAVEQMDGDDVVARFEVSDTGIGISDVTQGRLFDAFTQADGSTTRKYGGTGLGLAISKRLVELMGGAIGVRSAPGDGSTFWFTARFQRQLPATAAAPIARASLSGRRVLIVDDNATNRLICHYQVAAWGMEDTAVCGGSEALEALRRAAATGVPFDLAILDRHMPEMDGVMLARAIRADPAIAAVPLIMMTSLGNHGDRDVLLDAGIAECLTKPVKKSQLRGCVERVLTLAEPPSEMPVAPAAPVPPIEPAASRSRGRILVAEDNIVNQKVALLQLRKLGYTADAVANGAEAVDALARTPYDLVLMDCQMPEMDGFEATRLVRRRERSTHLTIIAMTANVMKGDREACLAAGMDDHIGKPIKPSDLEKVLTKWLTARSGTAQPEPDPVAP